MYSTQGYYRDDYESGTGREYRQMPAYGVSHYEPQISDQDNTICQLEQILGLIEPGFYSNRPYNDFPSDAYDCARIIGANGRYIYSLEQRLNRYPRAHIQRVMYNAARARQTREHALARSQERLDSQPDPLNRRRNYSAIETEKEHSEGDILPPIARSPKRKTTCGVVVSTIQSVLLFITACCR